MKYSFVIPTYTGQQTHYKMLFNDCLDSFTKFNGTDHEIIVTEDGGAMQQAVKEECERRGIKCILHPENTGFPRNVNRGVKAATGDVVIIVNNDIIFTHPVLDGFKEAFDVHPRIGIVGALLFYPNGTIQHGGILKHGAGFHHRGYQKHLIHAPEVQQPGYLIAVTGALFGIKREMFDQIGLFKDDYFLACDDTEYCMRAWTFDWRSYYSPKIRAIHVEGGTRGARVEDKIKYYRQWWIEENKTCKKFQIDILKFDLPSIHSKVASANIEVMGVTMAEPEPLQKMVFEGQQTPPPKSQTVLIRRTAALGDLIMATGVIKAVKKKHPDARIIVSTVCGDVLKNNPNVDLVVKSPEGIQANHFYDLDMSYENNPITPVWEAYSKTAFGEVIPEASQIEMFSGDAEYNTVKFKLGSIDPARDRVILVHMSVSWGNRTWPRHQWLEVSRKLVEIGYKVIVIGRGGDFKSDLYPNVLNLVDYLSLGEIRELCKRSACFVGMDSGMLHIAQTTDVPIVGLFTVANPQYRIIKRTSRTIALIPSSPCKFCLHRKNPPVTYVDCQYGDNHCLKEITSDQVVKEVTDCARKR